MEMMISTMKIVIKSGNAKIIIIIFKNVRCCKMNFKCKDVLC